MRKHWLPVLLACLVPAGAQAQVCDTGQICLTNDVFPCAPGMQTFIVIRGLCVNDKAACIFDLSGFVGEVQVNRGGILFGAGPTAPFPSGASGRMEIYDGATLNSNGTVTPGPLVHADPLPGTYPPNTIQMRDITPLNVMIRSGKMMMAFSMDTNQNRPCLTLAEAGFAADFSQPQTTCMSLPEKNLLYDAPTGQWWDVTRFRIGGQSWCGPAYNGNWVIRACVTGTPIPFPGTNEDLQLLTSVGLGMLNGTTEKPIQAGEFYNMQVTTPMGTFFGSPTVLLADLYLTSTGPPMDIFPGLHMGSIFFTIASTPSLGPLGLQSFIMPPLGSSGITFRCQGVAVNNQAQNGLGATTRGHTAVIQ